MGVTGSAVFQADDNPNDVTLWHDFDSAEGATAFLTSEELREAMQRAGVQEENPQTDFWVTTPS